MPTRKRATKPTRRRKATDASAPAYFLSLTVENVRCFGSPAQTLDLSDGNGRPKQWTIILGDNGVGKTTLLRSLVMLVVNVSASSPESIVGRAFASGRIGNHGSVWQWEPYRNPLHASVMSVSSSHFVGVKLREDKRGSFGGFKVVRDATESHKGIVKLTDAPADFFCIGYGAARRMSETSLAETDVEDAVANLFSDDITLLNAEEWLLRADYAAYVEKMTPGGNKRVVERRKQVEESLLRLLPDIEEVRFGKVGKFGAEMYKRGVDFKTPYGWIHLQELSLGYKTLIAWVVDFAARMFDRYPDSPNPLAEPAVCLVDEIDLHLHPTWQRKLIGYLTELFPNTQFIVTAHSPLVVQAATDANIVVLRREGDHVVIDNSVESLKGWSVDQILTSELYGLESARPREYDGMLAERGRLLSKSRLTKKDRARLQELEAEVDKLPVGRTPEDIKAMEIIRRAAEHLQERGDD